MKVCVSIYTCVKTVGYPNPPKVRVESLYASENKLRKFANLNSTPNEQDQSSSSVSNTSQDSRSSKTYRKFYEINSKDDWADLLGDLRNWENSIDKNNREYRLAAQDFKAAKDQILTDYGYSGKKLRSLPSRDADKVRRKLCKFSFHYTEVQFVIQKDKDDDDSEDFGIVKSKLGHYLTGYNCPSGFQDTHRVDENRDEE